MPSSASSGSRSRSATNLLPAALALALVLASAGCGGGDEDCGPGDAPVAGVTATIDGEIATFGSFTSSPNNDCPPPEGGPTSLTIEGDQADPSSSMTFRMTFCLPRPAELTAEPISLDDTSLVIVQDVNAELGNGCTLRRGDRSIAETGTIEFLGYCDRGRNDAGYAIAVSGIVPGVKTCPDGAGGMTEELVTIELGGSAAVPVENNDL